MGLSTWLGRAKKSSERRKHAREYGPQLKLTIDGTAYDTLDWSLGGFRMAANGTVVKQGDLLEGKIKAPKGAGKGVFTARVMRVADDHIGARWLEMSGDLFARLGGLGVL
jgi:hypothetical protein